MTCNQCGMPDNCKILDSSDHPCVFIQVITGMDWVIQVDNPDSAWGNFTDASFIVKGNPSTEDGAAILYIDTLNDLQIIGGIAPPDPTAGTLVLTADHFIVSLDVSLTHWTTKSYLLAQWELKALNSITGEYEVLASGPFGIKIGLSTSIPGNIILPGTSHLAGVYVVANRTEMTALTTVQKGDIVIITDDDSAYNGTWIALKDYPATVWEYDHVNTYSQFLPIDGSSPMTGSLDFVGRRTYIELNNDANSASYVMGRQVSSSKYMGWAVGRIDGSDDSVFLMNASGDINIVPNGGKFRTGANPADLSEVLTAKGDKNMEAGYVPVNALALATKDYVDTHAGSGGGSIYQLKSEKAQASGYAPLDANSKVPATYLPPTAAMPHHIFATQAAMLAGGASILAGENVLVHGDPNPTMNGEYVALQNAPTLITHYDHLGEHVAIHRHTGDDVDVTLPFQAGTETVQQRFDDAYTPKGLPSHSLSLGDLRSLEIGKTYLFPTTDVETSPGSGVNMPASDTHIAGIFHKGHMLVNGLIIRTGYQTWIAQAEEYTGTEKQPTQEWYMDADPLWPDHTGVGAQGATSFTNETNDLVSELGDIPMFGAHTVVDKIISNEVALGVVSTRIATLEGGAAHQHTDVVEDFTLWINNQGPGYLIINDRPGDVDHIGKALWDGAEHKVRLAWDTASPYTAQTPFDPDHFEDPASSGTYHSWVKNNPLPSSWLDKENAFKRMVDPVGGNTFAWAAISRLVDTGSILTVKWNTTGDRLDVLKVEQPTIHVVTSPDHQPLQVGGQIDAKSLPFVSLNSVQQTAVKFNSLFIDETQTLKWKDNSGTIHTVTLT